MDQDSKLSQLTKIKNGSKKEGKLNLHTVMKTAETKSHSIFRSSLVKMKVIMKPPTTSQRFHVDCKISISI